MKWPKVLLLGVCLFGRGTVVGREPQILHKEALPIVEPLALADPVPVPESIGATLLAGVGFLLMFRRRRYS
jgi:hypothetical protein